MTLASPVWLQDIDHWLPQPWLGVSGLAALTLVPLGGLWAVLDRRLLHGERVALKPTRFALSIALYLLTACWTIGYVRPERLSSPLVEIAVWGLLLAAPLELACITLQAARGRASHLNLSKPVDAAISAIMGVTAILFIGMVLPLAWEIACYPRRDADPLMCWAIVGGLVTTFLLGTISGIGMGRVVAGTLKPDALCLPLLGRPIRGGTLRIAHFMSVHAMQAFPLMASVALLFGAGMAPALLATGALCYTAATVVLLFRARSCGSPAPFDIRPDGEALG